ncbi:hypothetical protein EDD11_008030 [Mortierella claussenii]|nr:hypothetical protein EDD11_008030 [Mortierella claussenii]
MGTGIWAWLAPSFNTTLDMEEIDTPVHTLYLIYRGDDASSTHDPPQYPLDTILGPLLALCSSRLNVVSASIQDTEMDLARWTQSLRALTTYPSQTRQMDLASLAWNWCDSRSNLEHQSIGAEYASQRGIDALKAAIHSSSHEGNGHKGDDADETIALLELLSRCFRSIECRLPSRLAMRAGMEDSKDELGVDLISDSDLQNLADFEEGDKRPGLYINDSWFAAFTYDPSQENDSRGAFIDYPRITSGAALYSKLESYLCLLNLQPHTINASKLHHSFLDTLQERAFYYGVHTYHQIMNEHLDRQPIPVPWHTLAMVHHDAQSRSLEEIETRYCHGCELYLARLLREFREHCLEMTTTRSSVDVVSGNTQAAIVDSTTAQELMIPTGGLYLEYYSANASALQNHHLVTLDEHWQVLKGRLLGTQDSNDALASTTLSPPNLQTSRPTSDIKDYSDFLLAVDQVRRRYLETCIPSPEALSVLDNLDEMQQAESVVFLQSTLNNTATTPLSASPISLPTHLKRSPSISSSRPSLSGSLNSLIGVGIAELAESGATGGGDLLTDTLNGRRTSIQALATANGTSTGLSGEGELSIAANSSVIDVIRPLPNGTQGLHRQLEQAPTELEQQIAEIMKAKRQSKSVHDPRTSAYVLCLTLRETLQRSLTLEASRLTDVSFSVLLDQIESKVRAVAAIELREC